MVNQNWDSRFFSKSFSSKQLGIPHSQSPALAPLRRTCIILLTPVDHRRQLEGRDIGGQPLVNREDGLAAGLMRPGGGDLHVIAVPTVVGPGPVRGEVEPAQQWANAGSKPAEDVEVAALEVVVGWFHQAPGLQIRDPDRAPQQVAEDQADPGVGPGLDHRTRPHVDGVYTVVLHGGN